MTVMKRIVNKAIVICALAAAAVSCRVKDGDEFEPTALGFDFSRRTAYIIQSNSNTVQMLLHFNEYLAAAPSEREAIQDAYFYDKRISEREVGKWEIVGLATIFTGGALLDRPGATWSFVYTSATYPKDSRPTITCIAPNRYEIHYTGSLPRNTARYYNYYDYDAELALTVEVAQESYSDKGKPAERVCHDIDGRGEIAASRYSWTFDILSTLRLDTEVEDYPRFSDGQMVMAIDLDGTSTRPEAVYSAGGSITIHGGKDNAFIKTYSSYK